MAAARRHDVHRDALSEQDGLVTSAEIVKAKLGKTAVASLSAELSRDCVRVAQLRQVDCLTSGAREHQSAFRQAQRQRA